MAKIINILGCGRSGTSLVSETLIKNGVAGGAVTGGTFENLDARKYDDAYLKDNFQVDFPKFRPYGNLPVEEIETSLEYKANIKDICDKARKASDAEFFTFKDPRMTVLHDAWVPHADVIIGVYREPEEVASSYMKMFEVYAADDNQRRRGFTFMEDYWVRSNQSLLHVFDTLPGYKKRYMINFNDDFNKQIESVMTELGLEYKTKVYNPGKIEQKAKYGDPGDTRFADIKDRLNEWNFESIP